ncbi:MAG: c-type cytochrome [Candidatus Eremiobacteraeota bacterium]|nr:c-type cytochrome [Candidatus Eremiobacteraeota bacterium]
MRFVAGVLAVLVLAACSPGVSQEESPQFGTASTYGGDKDAGALVFAANCSSCHGSNGLSGGFVGPSLRHESMRMDYGTLVSWIDDPQPPMPKLYPKYLTENEVRDVAAYVESL